MAGSWLAYPEPVEGQPPRSAKSHGSGSNNVELVGQIGGQTKVVVVEGNYAYVAIGPSLMILDISNPANPTRIGQAILPDLVKDIAIVGNHAYVADGFSGLRVIDIAKPEQPIEVAYYDTPGAAEDVAIGGDYAYVADGYEGLRIINIPSGRPDLRCYFFR